MKKLLLLTAIFIAFSTALFASDVGDFLDKAKTSYASGDKTSAIQNIDAAKKLIEQEQIAANGEEYIEIANWDIVDLKSDFYVGKKVKINGTFYGVSTKDSINVGLRGCSFDSSLVDKILTLEQWKKYTFFGTIKTKSYGSPYLHVEAIQ